MRLDSLKLDEGLSGSNRIIGNKKFLICGSYTDARSEELHRKLGIKSSIIFSYDDNKLDICISGKNHSLRGMFGNQSRLPFEKDVLENSIIDITTLNISEMLILTKIASALGVSELHFSYGESGGYRKSSVNSGNLSELDGRDFLLSDELPEFKPIPFAMISPNRESNSKGVIIFGFEKERISKLFYDHEGIAEFGFYGLFQVPPSKPGWENDSTSQHHDIISEQHSNFQDFFFSSATDPNSTYMTIKNIAKGCDPKKNPLFVIPAGPKPTSLAVVVAWLDELCQGIFFDYPKLSANRSQSLRRIHIYRLHLKNKNFTLEK